MLMRFAVSTPEPRCRRLGSAGFTLSELLIVMAIIVLVAVLALPAFNLISGNRSAESAENKISAHLASTRSEAVGLQEPRGVIFFTDQLTNRTTLAQVFFPPGQNVAPGQPQELNLFGNRDEMTLPTGVGIQAIPNGTGAGGTVPAYPWPVYAVVM